MQHLGIVPPTKLIGLQGNKLQGKSAIVTGGSSGIGQGIVHYLTKAGAKVLIGDVQEPTDSINGPMFQKTDAGSWDDLLALFKRAEKEFGRIDIVVPNAGFGDRGDYFDHKDDNGDPIKPEFACLNVTLIGQMYTVKLAMHFMRKQQPQGGVIVSTVSRSGYDCQSIPVSIRAIGPLCNLGSRRFDSCYVHSPLWASTKPTMPGDPSRGSGQRLVRRNRTVYDTPHSIECSNQSEPNPPSPAGPRGLQDKGRCDESSDDRLK